MRVIEVIRDLSWVPRPNEVRVVLSTVLPPIETITAALALAFEGDRFLLTNLAARGWDIPGGHVEPRESPEEAMRREVYEETGARLGPARLIGYQQFRIFAPKPTEYRYPYPESHQVFYYAQVVSLDELAPSEETTGRALLPPAEARQVSWVRHHQALYEAALAAANEETGSP